MIQINICIYMGFPGGSVGKESTWNARDLSSIPGSQRSLGEMNGNPLQYYCWENHMDSGAWWATIHGVTKSWTLLSDKTITPVCVYIYIFFFFLFFLRHQFSSVQFSQSCLSLCNPMDCSTPGLPVHHQLPEFIQTMSIESVMPSNHLIFCHPLLLPPSVFPSIWSFLMSQFFASGTHSIGVSASASVLPMNIWDWFPSGLTGWISLQSEGLSRVFSNTTVQKHQFFGTQLS